MQQHIYKPKKSRIIKQSFLIWLWVATHIAMNIMLVPVFLRDSQIWGIILLNCFLSLLTVPSFKLFIRYYNHSIGKTFVVTYNTMKFVDDKTGKTIELNNAEIVKIYLVENPRGSKFPWSFHEYFSFVDAKQNKIIVTSYFMDISDFWLDTLSRKVSSNKLVKEEKFYPII